MARRADLKGQLERELNLPIFQILVDACHDHLNLTHAAASLGIHRHTFRRWCHEEGVNYRKEFAVGLIAQAA